MYAFISRSSFVPIIFGAVLRTGYASDPGGVKTDLEGKRRLGREGRAFGRSLLPVSRVELGRSLKAIGPEK